MIKKMYLGSLMGITTALMSISAISQETVPSGDTSNQVPAEITYTVRASSTSNAAILGGTVLPVRMVNLIAQMPGEVRYIAGKEGDAFEMGSQLVGLDIATLLEKRQAALAGLNSAQAGLANAEVQYQREVLSPNSQSNAMLGGAPSMFTMFSDPIRSFSGKGDPSYERHSNLFGQGVQIQTARDQIAQAQAGIRELDANIENAKSIAPFKGVITKKMVEVGDVVQPGMPLVVFADTSKLQIQVEVPARLISALDSDSIVSARLDGTQGLVTAKVARIFPMANQGGHTTTVKFDLPAGTSARAGMYAEILIPSRREASNPLAVIPKSAISWRGSLPAVFVISEDKTRLKMRTLRLGSANGAENVAVLSGVAIGDNILKEPKASTRSGPYLVTAE